MSSRLLHLALALYLVLGLTGAGDAVAEMVGAHDDCCADCDDPACPEDRGESCPPQCGSCVCASWMAPVTTTDVIVAIEMRPPTELSYDLIEISWETPPSRGVFRPPRVAG